jgi:hypothetical protein
MIRVGLLGELTVDVDRPDVVDARARQPAQRADVAVLPLDVGELLDADQAGPGRPR